MKIAFLILLALILISEDCLARGSFSRGASRGSFSSSRSYTPSRTTTTTTYSRSYGGSYYGYHPMMYGGFGMGYGYSNGLVEGLIIGSLMHPQGTVLYNGGGYAGDALLYPNGMVVNQGGYQVGTYQNGQFSSVNGGMVAQQAPTATQPPQQVIIQSNWTDCDTACLVVVSILIISIIFAIFI